MKKLLPSVLTVFFVAAASFTALAQPTLTAVSNNIRIGDQFLTHQVTIGAPEFATAAPAGASQIWNFTALTSTGAQQAAVLARSAAPNPTSYPAANMAVKIGDEYAYIENNNTSLKEHAAYQSVQNYSLENTDPAEKLRFPFTFNNTFTDAFAGTVNLAGNILPRNGSVTVTAEGYGTLITPAGNYANVLKVKTEEVANQFTPFSENTVTYDWYQAGTHFPLLRMTRRTTLAGTLYSGFFMDNLVGTKEELATQFEMQVFPNPASGLTHATLQFSLKKAVEVTVSLTDLAGKEINCLKNGIASTGKQTLAIPVSNLPKGLYFVRVTINGQVAMKRLVVQ